MAWPWQKKEEPAGAEQRASGEWGSSAIPLPGMGSAGGGFFAYTGRYVSPESAS